MNYICLETLMSGDNKSALKNLIEQLSFFLNPLNFLNFDQLYNDKAP